MPSWKKGCENSLNATKGFATDIDVEHALRVDYIRIFQENIIIPVFIYKVWFI